MAGLVTHEAIEKFMKPERGKLGNQAFEGGEIGKAENHDSSRLDGAKKIRERVLGSREVLQHHPAHDDIKILLRQGIILNISEDLLLQGCVLLEFVRCDVDSNGVHQRSEVYLTGGTAARLQDSDAVLSIQDCIHHFANWFLQQGSHTVFPDNFSSFFGLRREGIIAGQEAAASASESAPCGSEMVLCTIISRGFSSAPSGGTLISLRRTCARVFPRKKV